jgi:hypothetical protein
MRSRLGLVALVLWAGCSSGDPGDLDLSGKLYPVPIDGNGKDDGVGQPGPSASQDFSDTEAWKVRNQWTDRDNTDEARAAGMAWPAHSGLTWDQKYSAWIGAMQKIPAVQLSYGEEGSTYQLLTPYGKTMPAPSLECAETAMFLRATFAAWYGLPFYMEARDAKNQRVFVGHFGARTLTGRWGSSPAFAKYSDKTSGWHPGDAWPSDATLRRQALVDSAGNPDDPQKMIADDAHFGAYADEIFLNKRAGYLVVYILNFFYSGSLADPVNTYNLKPEAIREGDVLIRRWQRNGIGHTMVVKHMSQNSLGQPMAEIVAGGMPRHQGEWSDEVTAKDDLSLEDGGGMGSSDDKPTPVPYWQLGGGIKRWRAARVMNGSWINTYMPDDQASFISSTDPVHLTPRPSRFKDYLGEVPAPEKRDALLKQIDDARTNLSGNPSSCESRKDRERAFENLYALADKLGTTAGDLERQYRRIDDFVFRELDYTSSKTCCWDSSSPQMYGIIMAYAQAEQQAAQAAMMCKAPTVFRAHAEVPAGYTGVADGYQLWRNWAAQQGRSAEWIDAKGQPAVWHEDEECNQRVAADDTEDFIRFEFCETDTPSGGAVPDGGDVPDGGAAPDGGAPTDGTP